MAATAEIYQFAPADVGHPYVVAGTVGGSALALSATGEVLKGRVVGLAIQGLAAPLVEFTPACRLMTPLARVDETSGGMVLTIDGTPALDLLSSCMPEIRGAAQGGGPSQPQPVVFVALADPDPAGGSEAEAEGNDRYTTEIHLAAYDGTLKFLDTKRGGGRTSDGDSEAGDRSMTGAAGRHDDDGIPF